VVEEKRGENFNSSRECQLFSEGEKGNGPCLCFRQGEGEIVVENEWIHDPLQVKRKEGSFEREELSFIPNG